jgi:type II secretory pathway pseudopilin PulG
VELVFVIAIITVLVSIFLPLAISKLSKSDQVATDLSIQEIATGLTAFFEDLRHFPTCSGTDCSPFPGTENDLRFLAFGSGFGDLSTDFPNASTGVDGWNLSGSVASVPRRNNGANHLVRNDPDGDDGTDASDYESDTTKSKRWRGPYLARVGLDPFGRTFIAHVGAMEDGGTRVSGSSNTNSFGWILSAGPDNFLDTKPTQSTLQNDDRGFIFTTE